MAGKKQRRGRQGKRRGGRKSNNNISEYASMSVAYGLTTGSPASQAFRMNTMYNKLATNLSEYDRAVQIAQAYQFYRIKKIKFTFKPSFDTFTDTGSGTQIGKPTFYYMIDKGGSIPTGVSLAGIKQMGARGIALDEKPIHVSWSPSVLTAAGATTGDVFTGTDYKISPWLSTNADVLATSFSPSTVGHLGLYWIADQSLTPDTNSFYTIDVEVQFEFKKPIWTKLIGDETTQSVSL